MLYTLENDQIRAQISDVGAELQSLVGKKTGTEYLWQGNPTYWRNRSTVLFPICGRLTEGKYTYAGKTYEMCLHGIAKLQTFSVAEQTATSLKLTCTSNEETKAAYPFDFCFSMTYTLQGAKLTVRFTVDNTGAGDLPFSVGGHPGFNAPFADGEAFEDYYLEFACEKPARKLVMPSCFYGDETVPFPLRDGRILDLRHDLFDDDAIFLSDMCQTVSLKSKKNSRAVTVHFEDMTHLGFWQKPQSDAPYVCIEPWHGVPSYLDKIDDFATKNEFIHLDAGQQYSTYFDITVTE